jgi:hypothetical protein
MSYYLGQSTIPVRPVTRRATLTRGQAPRRTRRYLQRTGRKPLNRRAYPTMGTPVPVDLSMQPGSFGRGHHGLTTDYGLGESEDAFSMKGLNPLRRNGPAILAMQTRSGRRVMTRPYDPFSPVSLGQSILDPLSYTVAPVTEFLPSIPSVITAPAPSSGFIGGIFDSAANFMKNLSVSVDPLKTIQAVQQIIKPNQVGYLTDQLRRFGINPAYMGLPITGTTAQYGYQAAGINWMGMLPWVAGGAALLFVVPMLMGRRR